MTTQIRQLQKTHTDSVSTRHYAGVPPRGQLSINLYYNSQSGSEGWKGRFLA